MKKPSNEGLVGSSFVVTVDRMHFTNGTTMRMYAVKAASAEEASARGEEMAISERTADDQFKVKVVSVVKA